MHEGLQVQELQQIREFLIIAVGRSNGRLLQAGNDTLFDTNVPPEEFELISSGCWQAGDVQMTQCQDENDVSLSCHNQLSMAPSSSFRSNFAPLQCIAVIHEDKKATMGKETIGTAFCCCTTHNCNVEVTNRYCLDRNLYEWGAS